MIKAPDGSDFCRFAKRTTVASLRLYVLALYANAEGGVTCHFHHPLWIARAPRGDRSPAHYSQIILSTRTSAAVVREPIVK